jgi:molecular chaperone DnaJ
VTVEVPDAALGTRIEAPTLDGSRVLEIPAGTQPGSTFRLPGEGLPTFEGGPRGDLWVHVRVHVPERVTPEQHEHYEMLRARDPSPHEPERGQRGWRRLTSAIAKAWTGLIGAGRS